MSSGQEAISERRGKRKALIRATTVARSERGGLKRERRGGQASRPEVGGVRAARSWEEPERSVLEAAAPEGGPAAAAFPAPDPEAMQRSSGIRPWPAPLRALRAASRAGHEGRTRCAAIC